MESINISYRAEGKEFAAAYREYLSSVQISNPKEPFVMAAAWGASLFALLKTHGNPLAVTALALVSVIVGVRLYYMFVKPRLLFRKMPEDLRQVSYQFSGDGIVIRYSGKKDCVPWNAFCDVLETGKHFFLIQPNRGYTLVPRRVFRSEAEENRFRELVNSEVQKQRI